MKKTPKNTKYRINSKHYQKMQKIYKCFKCKIIKITKQ